MPPLEAAPRAAEAAERAIELDPTLAEGHTTLGFVRSLYQWRWDEGRREIERALEVNPNHAEAHFSYGWYQAAMEDYKGGLASMKRAFELDPLSANYSFHLEWAYLWTGQPNAAIRQHDTTEELAPGMVCIDSLLGQALSEQGRYEEAIEAFETAEPTLGRPSCGKGVTLARMGRTDEALQLARKLEEAFDDEYFIPTSGYMYPPLEGPRNASRRSSVSGELEESRPLEALKRSSEREVCSVARSLKMRGRAGLVVRLRRYMR
jgi:tetratricopeptide (TPR) repeat protein